MEGQLNINSCESLVGAWRSLVAHLLWEQGVLSSNLGAPKFRLVGMKLPYGGVSRRLCFRLDSDLVLPVAQLDRAAAF